MTAHGTHKGLIVACGLASVNGIIAFSREYTEPFDYQVTILEGLELCEDFTLGFYLAAYKATSRAIGHPGTVSENDFGWSEVQAPDLG
jgi:hypothetical protein